MIKTIIPAVAVAVVAGLGGYSLANLASAQNAPATQTTDGSQMHAAAQGWHHGNDGGWGHRHWTVAGWHRHGGARGFGLFYPQSDKKLTTADAQTIAQAVLLRHGNHDWKVTNVAANQDDTVSFSFATSTGDVIARFSMDTKTGRIHRLG